MKNTIKLLSVALVLTISLQSFGMGRIFSRLSKAGTRLATHARTQLASARTKLAQSATVARFMGSKPLAKKMVNNGLPTVVLASALAGVAASKNQSKEWAPEQMQSKLDELRVVETAASEKAVSTADDSDKNIACMEGHFDSSGNFHPGRKSKKEWAPEEMQEKLNELRVHEDAATDKGLLRYNTLIEGTYVCKNDASKERLKLLQANAKLVSQCISRERTYRTEEEENNDQANRKKCADAYLALTKRAYNPEQENGFGQWALEHFGLPIVMMPKPAKGDKVEVSIDINSQQSEDNNDHVASFKYDATGRLYRNRFMQLLYRPEFASMAAIDPTILKVRRTAIAAIEGRKDKDVVRMEFNMPFYFSNNLTVNRLKMLAALDVEPKASHQFITIPGGFQLITVQGKNDEATSKKE